MSTGRKILNLAKKRIGDTYSFGVMVPKDNPDWTGPWDCAEFASWCVYQVSGRLYGTNNNDGAPAAADAYTGFWKRDAEAMGTIITVDDAARTPGAAVLRIPHHGQRIGHIVFSDGNGGTVEAKSTNEGVVRDTLTHRRWDMGIIVPGISYTVNNEKVDYDEPSIIYRNTVPMMAGAVVKEIQHALNDAGVHPGPVDGFFGPMTERAVISFQRQEGLMVDGEVGPQTAQALGVDLRDA